MGAAAEKTTSRAEDVKTLLPQLEGKLSLTKTRQAEISRERSAISLAAHMGSAKDRARLDELNQKGAIVIGEIEGLEAAIEQAKTRIADAEAAAANKIECRKRREVSRLADEVRGHAERIDELWRQSIDEYGELQTKLAEIVQLGVGRPSPHQVRVACQRALVAAFIGTPLQFQILAPNERHTVTDLAKFVGQRRRDMGGKGRSMITKCKALAGTRTINANTEDTTMSIVTLAKRSSRGRAASLPLGEQSPPLR
jgi:hypothetical protein